MTLVATALTQTQVVQVSDRRRSLSGSNSSDYDHKTVAFCNHLIFSQAGAVSIGGEEAIEWLMSALRSCNSARDVPECISRAALAKVRASAVPTGELAFVGAGWAVGDDGSPSPYWCSISNFEEAFMEFRTPREDHFYGLEALLPPDKSVMLHLLRPELDGSLAEDVKTGMECLTEYADLDDPNAIAEHLVNYAQHIASRDDRVSSSLLVTSLPLAAAGRPEKHLFAFPNVFNPTLERDKRSYYFVRRGEDPQQRYAPYFVCPEAPWIVRPALMASSKEGLLEMIEKDLLEGPEEAARAREQLRDA